MWTRHAAEMTMDTQSLQSADLSRAAPCGLAGLPACPRTWGCPAPPSPPSASGALVAQGRDASGVSVIRSRQQHREDAGARTKTRSRSCSPSPGRLSRLSMVSPASTGSASSECSQDHGQDRPYGGLAGLALRMSPEHAQLALRDGLGPRLGLMGYPYHYPYAFADTMLTSSPSSAPSGDPALDALADLYAPAPMQHPFSYPLRPSMRPLRPWAPWRGLAAPPLGLAAPMCPGTAPAAPPPGPPGPSGSSGPAHGAVLKFGMDRILSDEGCGPNARRGLDGVEEGCPRDFLAYQAYPGPGLLAPTPLRIYGHAADARSASSPPRGGGLGGLGSQGGPSAPHTASSSASGKRKRSWSRAVFSNLQRKGLEKRFQLQKYITKPDRRQLAATLGLTDAQVKVWFQNRRMKWRHTKESKQQQQQQQHSAPRLDGLQQDAPKCDAPVSRCDSSP